MYHTDANTYVINTVREVIYVKFSLSFVPDLSSSVFNY